MDSWTGKAEAEARSVLGHFADEFAEKLHKTGKPTDRGIEEAIEVRLTEYVECRAADVTDHAEIVEEMGDKYIPERGLWYDEKATPAQIIKNIGKAVFAHAVREMVYTVLRVYEGTAKANHWKGWPTDQISDQMDACLDATLTCE